MSNSIHIPAGSVIVWTDILPFTYHDDGVTRLLYDLDGDASHFGDAAIVVGSDCVNVRYSELDAAPIDDNFLIILSFSGNIKLIRAEFTNSLEVM